MIVYTKEVVCQRRVYVKRCRIGYYFVTVGKIDVIVVVGSFVYSFSRYCRFQYSYNVVKLAAVKVAAFEFFFVFIKNGSWRVFFRRCGRVCFGFQR